MGLRPRSLDVLGCVLCLTRIELSKQAHNAQWHRQIAASHPKPRRTEVRKETAQRSAQKARPRATLSRALLPGDF